LDYIIGGDKMIRKIILLVIFLPSILCPRIFLVPEEFLSLQSVLIQAKNGDTISVKPPVYGVSSYRTYASYRVNFEKNITVIERRTEFQKGGEDAPWLLAGTSTCK
jgi:hypothetical protein